MSHSPHDFFPPGWEKKKPAPFRANPMMARATAMAAVSRFKAIENQRHRREVEERKLIRQQTAALTNRQAEECKSLQDRYASQLDKAIFRTTWVALADSHRLQREALQRRQDKRARQWSADEDQQRRQEDAKIGPMASVLRAASARNR